MITIANIAADKDLDRTAMSAVRGGTSFFSNSATNANAQVGGVSFGSAQSNIAPVTQADTSTHTNVDVLNVNKSLTSVGSLLAGVKL